MRGEVWRWSARGTGLGLGVLFVAAVTTVALASAGVLVLLIVSILLAAGLEPFVGWIRSRVQLPRGATVLLVYIGFLIAFVALTLVVVPAAADQLTDFSAQLPDLLGDLRGFVQGLGEGPVTAAMGRLIDTVENSLGGTSTAAPDPEAVVEAGLTAAEAIISAITILTLVFFWLTGHQRLQRFLLALLPAERRGSARDGWNEVEARMGLWVRGQLTLMASIFVMTTIAYWVLDLPNALLLGVIAGIAELIPIVGPALGAIPALLVAAVSGDVTLVLIVAAVYVVIQVVEGNVLVPWVMKNAIGVPPFVVIGALLIGGSVAGLIGALLAVPLTAAVVVILERMQARETPIALEGGGGTTAPPEEAREALASIPPDRVQPAPASNT